MQVFRSHREGHGIANGLVEPVIGAALEKVRLVFIGAEVEGVPQFVVHGDKVFAPNLDAHFQADVFLVVDVPGAGVAYHVAVARLGELRAIPEALRMGQEAE